MAAAGLAIRGDLSAADLRALARRERSRPAAVRMYAVANALEGMTRAEAARLAGLERQALRDAVVRYNADRKSVVSGKSVDLGGRRIITKKTYVLRRPP